METVMIVILTIIAMVSATGCIFMCYVVHVLSSYLKNVIKKETFDEDLREAARKVMK